MMFMATCNFGNTVRAVCVCTCPISCHLATSLTHHMNMQIATILGKAKQSHANGPASPRRHESGPRIPPVKQNSDPVLEKEVAAAP